MSEDRGPWASGERPRSRDDVVPYEGQGSAGADAPTDALATAGSSVTGGGGGAALGATGRREPGPRGPAPRAARFDPRPAAPARPAAPRRARLALTRVDPWSVFVLALLVSLFLGIVLLVAVGVLYHLLDSLGVLDSVTTFAQDLQILKDGQTLVSMGRVLGIAAVVAAVDVVLLTVLSTLAAFLYNLCASLTGGVEVVLAERE